MNKALNECMFTNKKIKNPVQTFENQVEAWRDFPTSFGQTAKEETKNLAKDAWKQIAGLEEVVQKLSGELKAGQTVDIGQMEQAQTKQQAYEDYPERTPYRQPGIDYHREFNSVREVRVIKEDTHQIQIRVDQILFELRNLTKGSQELAVQFEEVTMEETPVDAGTYHLNFFEWVFSVIQKARERIEESQTWLSLFKSKKKQKGYWNMFKKHGTTFGLSGERVVATQTG